MKAECSYDGKRRILTLRVSPDGESESALLAAFNEAGAAPKLIYRQVNDYFYDCITMELKIGK
jgi:hypothetical protein